MRCLKRSDRLRAIRPIAGSGNSWLSLKRIICLTPLRASDRSQPRASQLIYLALSRLLKNFCHYSLIAQRTKTNRDPEVWIFQRCFCKDDLIVHNYLFLLTYFFFTRSCTVRASANCRLPKYYHQRRTVAGHGE